jgi:transcriptional regulator with XRE-family HTH domain
MLRTSKTARNDFANRIKTLRAQKAITSTALAKVTGVSPAAIWQWEHSGVVPRRPTLAKLAATLRVSENFLLTGVPGDEPVFTAPSILPSAHMEDAPLEDLIRAIEAKGFVVTLRSKDS